MFKLFKIINFGVYLRTNETYFISIISDKEKLKELLEKCYPVDCSYIEEMEYLIKPSKIDNNIENYN